MQWPSPADSILAVLRCALPGRGLAAGRKFLAPPYYSQRAGFASLWAFFFISAVMQVMHVFDILTCWLSLLREFSANRISWWNIFTVMFKVVMAVHQLLCGTGRAWASRERLNQMWHHQLLNPLRTVNLKFDDEVLGWLRTSTPNMSFPSPFVLKLRTETGQTDRRTVRNTHCGVLVGGLLNTMSKQHNRYGAVVVACKY